MLTEARIQSILFKELLTKQHTYITPNTTALGWEGDMVSVTKSGLIHEHEIKISRSDFRADAKNKKQKHSRYAGGLSFTRGAKSPNYFHYVAPEGIIPLDEIPRYAGFIELDKFGIVRTRKNAPRLHERKADKKTLEKLATSLMWKVFKYGKQYQ